MLMNFLVYQLQVALIMTCFYALQRLLMHRETFHRLNRALLLGMFCLSFVLPFCKVTVHRPMPENMVQTVTVTETPALTVQTATAAITSDRTVAETVRSDAAQTVEIPAAAPVKAKKPFNWVLLLSGIWLAGFVFHLTRTTLSIVQIRRLMKRGQVVREEDGVRIVVLDLNLTPFSWMGTMVMSKQDYCGPNAKVIIDHESAHIRLGHSWDMLAVDLLSSMQWFNPVAAWLRTDLQEIHEFQADSSVLTDGFDAKEYQYMLLGRIASMNGFSVANHFKKKNLSNRIFMMNRKDSKFARAFKAAYAPAVTAVVIMSLAVTVYDCTPDTPKAKDMYTEADFSDIVANNAMFGDSIQILDAKYGQGKFSTNLWGNATIWMQSDANTARIEMWGKEPVTLPLGEIPAWLMAYPEGLPLYRVTIGLQEMGLKDMENQGLDTIRPFINSLAALGIRPLVVKTPEQARETYYSTYKYARIYSLGDGVFAMNHNGLVTRGSLKSIAEWVNILDIQNVAFFPDRQLTWNDAHKVMKVALARGVRTFVVCRIEQSSTPSLANILAEIKSGKKADPDDRNGTQSFAAGKNGMYTMTVLPTRPESLTRFPGHTLLEVADMLQADVQTAFLDKAIRTVEKPKAFKNEWSAGIDRIAFCQDEFIIAYHHTGYGRNVWTRPDADLALEIVADGKHYKMLRDECLPEFDEHPWKESDSYANGSLCWVPEMGTMYSTYHFEAVPADVKTMDLVEGGRAIIQGLKISDDDNRFDNVEIVSTGLNYTPVQIEGAAGPNQVSTSRIEFYPGVTKVYFEALIRATFGFPGHVNSDFTLTLADGSTVKIQGSEGYPLDQDFDRGGDHMESTVVMLFPPLTKEQFAGTLDYSKVRTIEDVPDAIQGGALLQGTLNGTHVSLKVYIEQERQ